MASESSISNLRTTMSVTDSSPADEWLIDSDDFDLVSHPVGREIYPAAVAAQLHPLFDHLFPVNFELNFFLARFRVGFFSVFRFFVVNNVSSLFSSITKRSETHSSICLHQLHGGCVTILSALSKWRAPSMHPRKSPILFKPSYRLVWMLASTPAFLKLLAVFAIS